MIELMTAANGGIYWRVKAKNGEILCHSEVYTTRQAALAGIEAVKRIIRG